MTYVPDDVVDGVIAKHQVLQDVVQGRAYMFWRPGQTATIAAQACMMFGGISTSLAVLWLWPLTVEHIKCYIFGGLLPWGAIAGVLFHAVLRGRRTARTHIYRYSIVVVCLSVCISVGCIVIWNKVSVAMACTGLLFNTGAMRLIAGEGYALTSALFRAQRAYADVRH